MKIVNISGVYVGTLKLETGGLCAYGDTYAEVIDKLFSLYWQSKTLH